MTTARTFAIGPENFELDGQPFRILAGSIHYPRVHPDLWADRIHKAKLMGLNTIETYVFWNFHSSKRGEFLLDGARDLARFLDLVAAEGMLAIVRPGPYACAEWDNGGLPTWLTSDPDVTIRSSDENYLAAVEEYLHQLAPVLVPRMIDAGGPIILMQVENEYGAYGSDSAYLARLVEIYREVGFTVPLTTVDQPTDQMLTDGSLAGVHMTGSFGGRVDERLDTLRAHQKTGPLMCAEFWVGWFDHWGARHHTTSAADSAASLERLLERGASVTVYMFHGGTNFGLTSGANDKGVFQPTVTSYDYDSPLAEDGAPTDKYWAFREIISRYESVPEERPAERALAPERSVALTEAAAFIPAIEALVQWRDATHPLDFEELEFSDGFALYRREVDGEGVLVADRVQDRAQVFVDGAPVGVLDRTLHDHVLPLGRAGRELTVLVENRGRVNYGPLLGEPKGLGPARVDGVSPASWQSARVPLEPAVLAAAVAGAAAPVGAVAGPVLLRATWSAAAAVDHFIDTRAWGRGIVWVNGFSLGRYASAGPQHTLYVPGALLHAAAENEVLVLELTAVADPTVRFVGAPDLGHTDF